MQKRVRSKFLIKLTSWEYWPFGIIQAPLFVMWIWYALKERAIFYFSASNPSIITGGMMGEPKYDILNVIPDQWKPKTVFVSKSSTPQSVRALLRENNLTFPLIFKPNLGERGWMVERIKNDNDVEAYLKKINTDFIIQECVDLPLEFGVYYIRFPSQPAGFVNSITGKEFLSVTGDGRKTLQELILEKDRAVIQWETLQHVYAARLNEIITKGEKIELVSIGNHCLGTMFTNCNHLITEKLSASFDEISKKIDGFYFGRFDLRCATVEDLENGRVKILELNGCGAEPAHIYQPGTSIVTGMGTLIRHWQNLYQVSRENHKRGVPYLSFREGKAVYYNFKKVKSA